MSGISTLTDGQIALILAGYLLLSNLLLINLLIAMFNQTVGTCVYQSGPHTLPKPHLLTHFCSHLYPLYIPPIETQLIEQYITVAEQSLKVWNKQNFGV